MVSPCFYGKRWTHLGLTMDSLWTHSEEGMEQVPTCHVAGQAIK